MRINTQDGIGQNMIFEEYCSYILSREKDIKEFTIPGTKVVIDKDELISNMRSVLRGNGYRDYDSLLVSTLKCYVSKDRIAKNIKFDDNMEVILTNIRSRVEGISSIYRSMDRAVPFSYERIFEILVYYLRLVTNSMKCDKEKQAHYVTAEISPEAVLFALNRKQSLDSLDAEWERSGWKAFYKDVSPLSSSAIDYYIKYLLLSTYIRYCEIMGK